MIQFRYEAVRPNGAAEQGTFPAPNSTAALAVLRTRRLLVVDLRPTGRDRRPAAPPVPRLAVLLRGIAALLAGGIPLDAALGASRRETPDAAFLEDLRRRVREGESLAVALEGYRGVPTIVPGLVRAGERSGLPDAVLAAAEHLERDAAIQAQVRGALAYPLLLLAVGTGTVAVLVGSVIPRFATLLDTLGQDIPATTRALLTLGTFVAGHGLVLAVVAALIVVLVGRVLASEKGHTLLLQIPVIGGVRMALASSRAARTLGAQLRAGAPTLAALEGAAGAAGDRAVATRLRAARRQVRNGVGLARALDLEHALDGRTLDLAALGESSGRLPDLLLHGGAIAESTGLARLRTLLRLVEPGLILLMAGGVAFVALALLQAVYGIRIR